MGAMVEVSTIVETVHKVIQEKLNYEREIQIAL